MEALDGIGMILGPVLGACLIDLCGFVGSFYLYAAFNLLVGILMFFTFPVKNESDGDRSGQSS